MSAWLSVTDKEFDELVAVAREAYNEGRWVSYPSNYPWAAVVRSVLDKRAAQIGESDGE